jgi:hypothetical protein
MDRFLINSSRSLLRNHMKFEDTVRSICGVDWRKACLDEQDGAFGVAIMIAFLEGCRPKLDDLVAFLELTPEEEEAKVLDAPFRRLQTSGSFFNARRDRALNGWEGAQDGRTGWCHIAAIASGVIGAGYFIQREIDRDMSVTCPAEPVN